MDSQKGFEPAHYRYRKRLQNLSMAGPLNRVAVTELALLTLYRGNGSQSRESQTTKETDHV